MAIDISKIKDRDTANAFDAAFNLGTVTLGTVTGGSITGTALVSSGTLNVTGISTLGVTNASGNMSLTGTALLLESSTNAITAAGANRAAGTVLTTEFNRVNTATANQGVVLMAAAAGLDIYILNDTTSYITVYANGSDTVDGVAGATGVSQMPKSVVLYTAYATGAWSTNGLATGYAANPQGGNALETVQFADAVSAAGSSQAAATQLTAALNTVSTATANQGVNLPASSPGLMVAVQNTSGNTIIVYPAQSATDTINGVAAATGVALLPGSVAVFNCTATGAWNTLPATAVMDVFNTASNTTGFTASAAQVTGGQASVVLALTGALGAGANITTPTATAWIAALHCPSLGTTYRLRIINESSGAFSWTVVAGSGVTLTGTATIAQNTWREYDVKVTNVGTPAVTIQNVGTGTFS